MNRRRARRVVAALFLGFLGLLALSYRPPRTAVTALREEIAPTLLREAPGVRDTARFRQFEYVETRPSESTYRLRAQEAIGFEVQGEQIFRLKDAVFESKEPGSGRALVLSAPRAEFVSLSKAVKVFDGVRIEGEGTTLHGDSFRYDPALRLFISDGPVSAVRDELVAHASEGRLETRDGIVDLGGAVRVRGRLEGGRTVDLSAPRVRLGRSGHLRAEGDVVVKSGDGILRCKTFERSPTETGDEMKAEGDARLLVPPQPPQPDAPFLAWGETITLARDEKADSSVLVLTGAPDRSARVDLAPSQGGGARRATSASFTLRLEAGALRELTSPAAFDSAEEGSARGKEGALRTLTAGFGRFLFAKETRSLDVATLEKGLDFADGARARLTATHGTYRASDDTAIFSGDPGTPARYRDERGTLVAETIAYAQKADRVDAHGEVQATYTGGGGQETGLLGGAPGEPFHSRSESLRLLVATRDVTLTGSVQAWQKENVLRCDSLRLSDVSRTLDAQGNVKALLRRKPGGPAAGAKKGSETINASGDRLTHHEADRFVRIAGHATIVSGNWVMNSHDADIRLAPDRSIEYAEARGEVVLEDRAMHRRGEGSKATWRPDSDTISLDGAPAAAIDGTGNRLTGATLTFRQGRSRVDVQSSESVPTEAVIRPEGS